MKTILCPTDFSDCASGALEYAANIALKADARLVLLHAHHLVPVVDPQVPAGMVEEIQENSQQKKKEKLEELSDVLNKGKFKNVPGSVKTEAVTCVGFVMQETLRVAEEKEANLIVMGTHGASGVKKVLLGSNTNNVIRKAKCPVLAVPCGFAYREPKKVAFATDLREKNLKMAEPGLRLLRLFNAELMFLFVDREHTEVQQEEIKRMTQVVRDNVNYPKISGHVCSDPHVLAGINLFIDHEKADMLIMVTRKRSLFESVINPSLTSSAAYHPRVPLLALHA